MGSIAKVWILMTNGILSSCIMISGLFFGLATYTYIDSFINIICVLLMHKINKTFYDKVCKGCHNKIYSLCYNYIEKQKIKMKSKNIENPAEI